MSTTKTDGVWIHTISGSCQCHNLWYTLCPRWQVSATVDKHEHKYREVTADLDKNRIALYCECGEIITKDVTPPAKCRHDSLRPLPLGGSTCKFCGEVFPC